MTANRAFWLMLLALAVYVGADQLADYIGSASGSIWAAVAIGVVAGSISQIAFQPFVKQAQEAGFLDEPKPKRVSAIIGKIVIFAAVTTFIIFVAPRSSGSLDYTKPFVIGFWAAILLIWLVSAAKFRKLDSSK